MPAEAESSDGVEAELSPELLVDRIMHREQTDIVFLQRFRYRRHREEEM